MCLRGRLLCRLVPDLTLSLVLKYSMVISFIMYTETGHYKIKVLRAVLATDRSEVPSPSSAVHPGEAFATDMQLLNVLK